MGEQRSYTKEYKVQAVKLVLEVGITKAARELGVSDNTLYGWRRAYQEGRLDLGPGTQTPQGAMTLAEEVNLWRKRALFSLRAVGSQQEQPNEVYSIQDGRRPEERETGLLLQDTESQQTGVLQISGKPR